MEPEEINFQNKAGIDVKDWVKEVRIKNFKSIKDLRMDCRRVNIFIGKPNVGKSNILEALSLFCVPLSRNDNFFKGFIRHRELRNLFHNPNLNENIMIQCKTERNNHHYAVLRPFASDQQYDLVISPDLAFIQSIRTSGPNMAPSFVNELYQKNLGKDDWKAQHTYYNYFNYEGNKLYNFESTYQTAFKKYTFKRDTDFTSRFQQYLLPPYGENLVSILRNHPDVLDEAGGFFEEAGYELLVDTEKNDFAIQRKIGKVIYQYPFELIADTLQRIIFYLAAIETNHYSTLLFEEPETHSFPPYIKLLADRIAMEKSNQYFIATHSPYLLHTLIENLPDEELSVYITYFEDFETKVKLLNAQELGRILDEGIDVFFNLDKVVEEHQ